MYRAPPPYWFTLLHESARIGQTFRLEVVLSLLSVAILCAIRMCASCQVFGKIPGFGNFFGLVGFPKTSWKLARLEKFPKGPWSHLGAAFWPPNAQQLHNCNTVSSKAVQHALSSRFVPRLVRPCGHFALWPPAAPNSSEFSQEAQPMGALAILDISWGPFVIVPSPTTPLVEHTALPGDDVKKLDIIADDIWIECLTRSVCRPCLSRCTRSLVCPPRALVPLAPSFLVPFLCLWLPSP